VTEYRSKYGIPFEIDANILDDLRQELENNGLPSLTRVGVGVCFGRSLPYVNNNGHCFTAKCLKNSIDTAKFGRFDFNHETNNIFGSMIGLKTYDDTNDLIPETPMRVFGYGALLRDRLREYYINPDELPYYDTSLEVVVTDYDFYHKGQIIRKEDARVEWIEKVDDMIQGIPFVWENYRVNLIIGGVDDDAKVEFSGNALLTVKPADSEARVLLAVASLKQSIIDNKEGELFVELTEKQLQEKIDEAVANAKAEVKAEYETKLTEKDTLLKESSDKLQIAESSLATEKEAKEKAQDELQKIAVAKLVSDRKTALAAKNYTEFDEEDEKFLATASESDFNSFVKRIEKVAVAASTKVKTEFEAKASQFGLTKEAIASLQLTEEEDNKDKKDIEFDISYML
jgi:hypothetical protein